MTQKTPLHATAVVIEGKALLLRGKSGSGKSDLALRLIDRGARLLSDDQVMLEKQGSAVVASAPEPIRGMIEARGVGLLAYPVADPTPLRLVIDLVPREEVPRLPEGRKISILGIPLPLLQLYAFDASTPLKIAKALALLL